MVGQVRCRDCVLAVSVSCATLGYPWGTLAGGLGAATALMHQTHQTALVVHAGICTLKRYVPAVVWKQRSAAGACLPAATVGVSGPNHPRTHAQRASDQSEFVSDSYKEKGETQRKATNAFSWLRRSYELSRCLPLDSVP